MMRNPADGTRTQAVGAARKRIPNLFLHWVLAALFFAFAISHLDDSGISQSLGSRNNEHQMFDGFAVAMSRREHGLREYLAYPGLFDVVEQVVKDGGTFNEGLERALEITEPRKLGEPRPIRQWFGNLVFQDYLLLSTIIFGYQIEALFYLYFLLTFIAVLVGIYRFRHDAGLMALFSFVPIALVLTVSATNLFAEPILLDAIHEMRFLGTLSVVPTLYLCLSIFDRRRITIVDGLLIVVQSLILLWAIAFRTSALLGPAAILVCVVLAWVLMGSWAVNGKWISGLPRRIWL
ncbi:MAG: hypothetical protein CL566_09305, partial [Alphaproteobacteria bacterium]|nr:hypothetical protein [Alphaproteobacteria bacterium]